VGLFDKFRRDDSGQEKRPAYPAGKRMYAIGDIHGRHDLLEQLHEAIEQDAAAFDGDKQVVYLGDFVDRGEGSRQVIDHLLSDPLPGFESIYLMGNHEHAALSFLDDPHSIPGWLSWGGRETLYSYGIQTGFSAGQDDLERLRTLWERAMPAIHLKFLESCQVCHHEGDYYFVHAGIRPGIALHKQVFEDQLWIREPFLSSTKNHGAVVVHGHTISEEVVQMPNRIGLDTGAFRSGVLSCLVLEGEQQRLLQTGGGA
jgi:serine/threonine protein phosphatase 1